MCLGAPAKVIEVFEEEGVRMGVLDFGGVHRNACLTYAPEADVGSYVLVHTGFAVAVIEEEEAVRTLDLLQEMGSLATGIGPTGPRGQGPRSLWAPGVAPDTGDVKAPTEREGAHR